MKFPNGQMSNYDIWPFLLYKIDLDEHVSRKTRVKIEIVELLGILKLIYIE